MSSTSEKFVKVGQADILAQAVGKKYETTLAGKQDAISDLSTIRSGAALGATAIQTHQDISGKVDKVTGKSLSTNDYTDSEKAKVAQVADKADKAQTLTTLAGYPQDNTTYVLGETAAIVLSQNGTEVDACKNGTVIYFTCPSAAATSLTYKTGTKWVGTDAPSVLAGQSYVIAIIDGVYRINQVTTH